jgi:hypothetical protein
VAPRPSSAPPPPPWAGLAAQLRPAPRPSRPSRLAPARAAPSAGGWSRRRPAMWGPPGSCLPKLPSPSPFPNPPRARSSPPHLARPPLPHPSLAHRRRRRPTIRGEPRSSLPLPPPPPSSLGLVLPRRPPSCSRRAAMAAMAPNPARLAAMALTHARSRRPRPAGPGSPSPASRPQHGRPWRGHGVPHAAPCFGCGAAWPRRPWRARARPPSASCSPCATQPPLPLPHARPRLDLDRRCARPGLAGHGARARPPRRGPPPLSLRGALASARPGKLPCAATAPRRVPGVSLPSPRPGVVAWRGVLGCHTRCAAPAPRPPQRALSRPSQRALPLPGAALSSARHAYGAWPRAVGLGVAPLPLATRNAVRVRLGPGVCAARPRCVIAALRIRARVERVVLWHGSPCPRRVRLPIDVPVYPPCIPCVVIALFLSINEKSI